MTHPLSTVAAFDFDGTLTYRDTLISFLLFSCGLTKTTAFLAPLIPAFIRYECGLLSRQQTKERVLQKFFEGMPGSAMQKLGQAFAKDRLNTHLRPNALGRIQWHLSKGHRCILVSASIDTYLHPWAHLHGFHDAITSELAIDEHRCITGLLEGKNCWGEEKARRLAALLGPRENYVLYAYGDSRGDQEMLKMADFAFYRSLE